MEKGGGLEVGVGRRNLRNIPIPSSLDPQRWCCCAWDVHGESAAAPTAKKSMGYATIPAVVLLIAPRSCNTRTPGGPRPRSCARRAMATLTRRATGTLCRGSQPKSGFHFIWGSSPNTPLARLPPVGRATSLRAHSLPLSLWGAWLREWGPLSGGTEGGGAHLRTAVGERSLGRSRSFGGTQYTPSRSTAAHAQLSLSPSLLRGGGRRGRRCYRRDVVAFEQDAPEHLPRAALRVDLLGVVQHDVHVLVEALGWGWVEAGEVGGGGWGCAWAWVWGPRAPHCRCS